MKTKLYLRSAQTIQEKYMAQVANRIIELFVEDIKDEGKHHRVVLKEFKKRLSDFDKEWKARVPKKPLNGRSCKHIMLQTISKFSIHDFIQKKFDFTFHHKKEGFTYMSYSMDKFVELSKMEVAMLLYKYGDDLMAFEIEIAIAELLTNYFALCLHYTHVDQNKWQWCFQPTEFHVCVDLLLNMELSEYKQYYNYFTSDFELVQHDRTNEIQYEKRFQPTSIDELKRLYKEGMTQAQFNEAIAFYYNISINTARIWRQKFGLSRHYKNSKANKNNVTSVSNEQTIDISNLENEISQLQQLNLDMKSKIHSLQEENDMLKKNKNDLNFNADSIFLKEKIKILEVNNGSLKIENDNLKKQIEEYREDLEKMRSLIKRVYEETNNDALASYAQ